MRIKIVIVRDPSDRRVGISHGKPGLSRRLWRHCGGRRSHSLVDLRSEAWTFHDQQGAVLRNRGGGARNAEGSNVRPGSFLGRSMDLSLIRRQGYVEVLLI
jgi:hypothetical protein